MRARAAIMKIKPGKWIRNRRKGATIVLIAIILPVLIMILGFSVDLANMQRVRTELRTATDLAAKAAADELSATNDTAAAITVGKSIAALNLVSGESLTLEDEDFVFGRSVEQTDGTWLFTAEETPPNAVRLTGRRTSDSADGAVHLYFGFLYGRTNFEPEITATSAFVNVDICLVLDRSSSMKLAVSDPSGGMGSGDPRKCVAPMSDSRWVAVESAVNTFMARVSASTSNEQVAVVTFASDNTSSCGETNTAATIDANLTTNVTLINTAMSTRSSGVWNGSTEIDAGISLAQTVLTGALSRPLANKIMIVLTDGVYTGSDPVPNATTANAAGITVHTITFGVNANQPHMQSVAQAGGGSHFHAPDAETLNDVFNELAGTIAILTE